MDGSPIPDGLIAQQSGTLTGTLDSGEAFSVGFFHRGLVDPACFLSGCNGQISVGSTPPPPPSVPLLPAWGALLLAAALLALSRRS